MADEKSSAVPPVDVLPAEVDTFGTPAMPVPPSQVNPPPLNAPAKNFLRAGTPVTQETVTRQTIYPGSPKMLDGILPHMLEAPGANKKSKSCIEFMASLSQDPNAQEFSIEVHRTAPAIHNGQRLYYGVIERFPPAPYPEIYEQIRQVHGGGGFRLLVKNGEGSMVHQMVFNIDTLANPPINNVPNGGRGMGGSVMTNGIAAFHSIGGAEMDDTVKLKNEEARLRAEEARMLTEARVEQTRENIERQREKRLSSGSDKAVDTLRSEMKEMQHQTDLRFAQMMASLEKTVTAIAAKPADNSSMLLFAEMMKAQTQQQIAAQQQQTALLTSLLGNNNKGSELAEAMKLQNESNKQIVQMTLQSATAAASKSERLMEQMLVSRMEHPDNAVRQALEMRESGWKQAMQVMEMMNERGMDDREEVLNQDSGFFGNLGNLFLHGLKNLVAGGAKGAGGQMMSTLASMLNKPQGTTNYTDAELQVAAQQLAREELARRALPNQSPIPSLPAPRQSQQIMPPAPLPAQSRMNPMQRMFDRVYFEDEPPAMTQQVVEQQEMEQQVSPLEPIGQIVEGDEVAAISETESTEVTASTENVATADAVPGAGQTVSCQVQPTEEDEDLRGYVNEAIAMAISDLKAGRKEHDWVDFALAKWNHAFLVSLVRATDDSERVKLIQKYAEPALFQEMVTLLMNQENNSLNYRNFIENMQHLLEEAGREAVGA